MLTSIPNKREGFASTLAEVKEMNEKCNPQLKQLRLTTVADIDNKVLGEAYYEMQTQNPLFLEAKLTKEDIVTYGAYLAERAKHLAPWNIVLVDSEGTVAGFYFVYPANSEYHEEERPKIIPKVCEDHWQTCLWFENVVGKRTREYVKKQDAKANFSLCRSVFSGVHPKFRGMGVYEYVAQANSVASEINGFTHIWSFTFQPAFFKKSLVQRGFPDWLAGYTADNIPKSSRWTLETLLIPTLKAMGFIRSRSVAFAVPKNGLSFICGVWPVYDDVTTGSVPKQPKEAKL